MSYFYGPVPSRRLGFSLGVNLLPKKICPFDCIYCQLGKTKIKSVKRFTYVNLNKLKRELRNILKKKPRISYITISGSGEPTLHKNLDKIIVAIKKATKNKYPVCVVTNSSLFGDKKVRAELKKADLVIPSLDAATANIFNKIDRPCKSIDIQKITEGLIEFRKEFKGRIWLEIMLVGNINDTLQEAKKLKEVIKRINPDKIQLNIPVRPAGYKISLPEYEKVKAIKHIIGSKAEVVSYFHKERQKRFSKNAKEDIINFLKARPASAEDLVSSLGLKEKQVFTALKELLFGKKVKVGIWSTKKYFFIRDD